MLYLPNPDRESEVIDTEQDENGTYVPVTAAVHPLKISREIKKVKVGTAVSEVVKDLCPVAFVDRLCVTINGELIEPDKWDVTVLTPLDVVVLRAVPQGGNTGKQIESIVLTLAVIAVAFAVGGPLGASIAADLGITGTAAVAAVTAATIGTISALGMLAVNALIPPSQLNTQTYKFSLAGTSNQALPYGTVPRVLGRTLFTPPIGALPYTTYAGDSQWLYCLFDLGPGPINISDIKLGQTPIGDFADLTYYTYEGRNTDGPLQLYNNAITVPNPQPYIVFANGGDNATLDTGTNVSEIEIDISYPGGLFNANGEGNLSDRTVSFSIVMTNLTTSQVITDTQNVTGGTTSLVGVTYRRHNLPAGQYSVQLTQTSGAPAAGKGSATGVWTGFRYMNPQSGPILPQNHAKIEVMVRATEELNGTIESLNCIAQAYVQVWDGSSFSEQLNTHPAWAAYTVMTDPNNPRPLVSSQIDLTGLLNWATTYPDAEFNYVFGTRTTIWQALRSIGAAGRAVPVIRDGLYSFVADILQSSPTQIFTARTVKDFKATRMFVDQIEGMAIQYISETMGWQEYTTYTYAAGFNAGNVTGSELSSIFLPGVTSDAWAYALGTYYFACVIERANKYTFDTSLDHLACNIGDRVWVQHDVVSAGIISGRIISMTRDGSSHITSITLDEETTGDGTSAYSLIERTQLGGVHTLPCTVSTSPTNDFPIITPYDDSADPVNVGDVMIMVTTTIGVLDAIVKTITPKPDFMATVTCLDYVPSLFDGDGVTPPPVVNTYNNQFVSPLPVASVVITSLIMDESSSLATSTGQLIPQIQGQFIVQQNGVPPTSFDVQWQSSSGLVLATGFYTATGNFAAGDTVKIGSMTYTFVSSIGSTPGNVLVGGSAALSLGYLSNSINNNGTGVGTDYVAQTAGANPDVVSSATSTVLTLTALTSITAAVANAVATVYTPASTSYGSFATATLANGVDLVGWTAIPSLPAGSNSFAIPISAAAVGQTFNVRIRGNNTSENNPSAWYQASITISNYAVQPLAPVSLVVTPIINGVSAAVDGSNFASIIQYNLYANTAEDFETASLVGSSPSSPFSVTGLSATTVYFFWATTITGSGVESLPVGPVSAIPLPVGYYDFESTVMDFIANIGKAVSDLQTTAQQLTINDINATFGGYEDFQTLNASITASAANLTAGYTSAIAAAVGGGSAIATDITTIQTALTGYLGASAVSTAVNSLQSQITTSDGNITTLTSDITTINSALSGYLGASAVSTAVTSLQTQITTSDGNISTSAANITTINSALSGYLGSSAVSTAVNSLQTQITTNGTNITANSSSITTLNSQVGNFYSSGLFRVDTSATEAGAAATITIGVAATSGGSPTTAAMFLSAMTGGASQITMLASQFYITDGTNLYSPFYFSGGTAYIQNAVIQNLDASIITTGTLDVGTVVASGAITSALIASGAITSAAAGSATSGTSLSVNLTCHGGPVFAIAVGNITGVSGSPSANCSISNITTSNTGAAVHYTANTTMTCILYDNTPPTAGTNTYVMGIFGSGTVGSFQSVTMFLVEFRK